MIDNFRVETPKRPEGTTEEQIQQIYKYLFDTAERTNIALSGEISGGQEAEDINPILPPDSERAAQFASQCNSAIYGKAMITVQHNEDLNDILYRGRYAVPDQATADTLQNLPVQLPGLLIVESSDGSGNSKPCIQTYRAVGIAGTVTEYQRTAKGGNFVLYSEWKQKGATGWIDLGLSDKVQLSSKNFGHYKGCAYKVVDGQRVIVAFNCAGTYSGTSIVVNGTAIPQFLRPARHTWMLCPIDGKSVARCYVSPAGNVIIDFVEPIGAKAGGFTWIDGYIEYWLD